MKNRILRRKHGAKKNLETIIKLSNNKQRGCGDCMKIYNGPQNKVIDWIAGSVQCAKKKERKRK